MEIPSIHTGGSRIEPKQLSTESQSVFRDGISLVLSRWSALQLAVDQQWAGRRSSQLAEQFLSSIFHWFIQSKEPLYIDDLENILDEGMETLNVIVDDGSVEEIAEKLMTMHGECLEGNFNSIEKLKSAGPSAGAHQHVRQVMDEDDDDDSDEEDDDHTMNDNGSYMMVDAPKSESKPNTSVEVPMTKDAQAEDGWEVVSSRRNRGKKTLG